MLMKSHEGGALNQEKAPNISIGLYNEVDKTTLLKGIEGIQETERAVADTRLPGAEIAEAYLSELEKETKAKSGAIYVAKNGDDTAGFIACWIEREENVAETPESNTYGYISDAYVAPEYRNQGVFRRLSEQAESHLKQNEEVKIIRINVLADNETALRAYENTGYKPETITLMRRIERE
jgi:ribosomal protein S18 acetylase RimI-like enzyme